jgi:hypothetical protein
MNGTYDLFCIWRYQSASDLQNVNKLNSTTGFSCSILRNGVDCILVNNNISYQVLDLSSLSTEEVFEACVPKIPINKVKLCILCLYRVPDGGFEPTYWAIRFYTAIPWK